MKKEVRKILDEKQVAAIRGIHFADGVEELPPRIKRALWDDLQAKLAGASPTRRTALLADYDSAVKQAVADRRRLKEEQQQRALKARRKGPKLAAPDGRGKRRAVSADGKMLCRTCRAMTPLTDFYVHVAHKGTAFERKHYDSNCNACRKSKMVGRLRGIDARAHQQLIRDAGGKCEICGRVLTRPNIDHCHATGLIRGVLCSGCNSGLGHFKDSSDLLRNAIAYLERATEKGGGVRRIAQRG